MPRKVKKKVRRRSKESNRKSRGRAKYKSPVEERSDNLVASGMTGKNSSLEPDVLRETVFPLVGLHSAKTPPVKF